MKRLLLVAVLAVLPVAAQAPRGFFPWWDTPIAKDLNLTEDQQKQIRSVVRDSRTKLIDLRASVEKAEIEVEETFNDESFSQTKANDAVEKLVAARGEMTRSLSQLSLKLRAVLTAEQWRELQKRRPKGMMPGQGGPGGPGNGPGQNMNRRMQRQPGQNPPPPGGGNPPPPQQE